MQPSSPPFHSGPPQSRPLQRSSHREPAPPLRGPRPGSALPGPGLSGSPRVACFSNFSLSPSSWTSGAPPSPPCCLESQGPDPEVLLRIHKTEGYKGAQSTHGHQGLQAHIRELPLRSVWDVTLLRMWVSDPASPFPPVKFWRGLERLTRSPGQEVAGEEGSRQALLCCDQMFISIPVRAPPPGRCQAGGARAVGEGPDHPQLSVFPALRGCGVTRRPASHRSWRGRWRRPAGHTAGTGSPE